MEAPGAPLDERRERVDERLLVLLDAVDDAMFSATLGGRIIGGNLSACRRFGYTREELGRLSRSDLVKDSEALARAITQGGRPGSACGVLTFVRKNGETFEGELKSVELATSDGQERLWLVVHDLADRLQAEQAAVALRESNEMLKALTDAAFEAVVIHRDGVILVANRAAEEAARVAPGELAGKQLFDFIAPEALPMVLERIASNNEEPYESFGRRSDGSIYPLEVQVRVGPVNVNGAPARVAALRDLTDRKKLEDELRHASGRRVILVVDDEPVVRKIVVHVLRRAGFEVLDADGPATALAVLEARTAGVDLLITDMLLGGESGRSLAADIQKRRPGIAVLFMSGYPDGALEGKSLCPDDHFLHKPFTPQAVVGAVERVLAGRAPA